MTTDDFLGCICWQGPDLIDLLGVASMTLGLDSDDVDADLWGLTTNPHMSEEEAVKEIAVQVSIRVMYLDVC